MIRYDINILIAERIFRWTEIRMEGTNPMPTGIPGYYSPENSRWKDDRCWVPNYSSDIGKANSILEHFQANQIQISNKANYQKGWQVSIGLVTAIAETLPETICLAALKFIDKK
jgi:hypothetical protein